MSETSLTTTTPQPARRRRTSGRERAVVAGIALVAGLLALSAGAEPTDIDPIDSAYAIGAGVVLALAGSRSRRWTWIASSIAAVWVATSVVQVMLGLVALAIAIASAWLGRTRWMGAATAIPLVVILGDLGSGSFYGSTTLTAVAVASPMLLSASLHLTDSGRQTVIASITIVAAFAVLATVLFAAAVLLAQGDLGTGVDEAQAGFDLASEGDETAASERFDAAAAEFDAAGAVLGGPWMFPARLVPVLSQHARAVQVMVSEGESLSETAAEVSRNIDPDLVRLVDGRVDLEAIDRMTAPLDRAERAIERASERIDEARDAWLIGPVEERLDELGERLDGALPAARTASAAAAEAPELLGRDGPVRWFVGLTTPAEARGLGGLLGNYATVIADDGRLTIESVGRNEEINNRLRAVDAELVGPDDYVARWGRFRPQEFFQDVTLSPDLPSVAVVTASLYEQATGQVVDGVVFADPFVIGAVLELTGPVTADGRRLGPDEAVDFLLREQYEEYENDELGRIAILEALVRATFEAITGGSLPGARGLAEELGPMVEQDRLGMWWGEGGGPDELLSAAGLDGGFPDPHGGDLLGLVHQNSGQNKIDVHLDRRLEYVTTIDGRQVDGVATITLANAAPSSGLPDAVIGNNDQGLPAGTNSMHLSLYTALEVLSLEVDGRAVDFTRQSEFGVEVVSIPVEIAPGSEVVVRAELSGAVDQPGRLTLVQQPLVNRDVVSVWTEDPESGPSMASRGLTTDMVIVTGE